jgi:hypothetical protein
MMPNLFEPQSQLLYPVCETVLRRMENETAHLVSLADDAQARWTAAYRHTGGVVYAQIGVLNEKVIAALKTYLCNSALITTVITDEYTFKGLLTSWHSERGATSSITQMVICRSYQRIIGMGDKAIPLILRDLEDHVEDPDHWFWALQALTGANPVPAEDRGDMSKMARAWLEWAYLAGYDW